MELGVGMLVDAVGYEIVREERRGRTEVQAIKEVQRTDGLRPEERRDLRRTRQRAMRFDAVEDVCGVFLIVRLDMLVHLAQHLLH